MLRNLSSISPHATCFYDQNLTRGTWLYNFFMLRNWSSISTFLGQIFLSEDVFLRSWTKLFFVLVSISNRFNILDRLIHDVKIQLKSFNSNSNYSNYSRKSNKFFKPLIIYFKNSTKKSFRSNSNDSKTHVNRTDFLVSWPNFSDVKNGQIQHFYMLAKWSNLYYISLPYST